MTSLFLLAAYNYTTDLLKTLYSGAGTVTNAVCNYLNGTSNEWYFVEDAGVIPAVAYSILNQTYRDRILWTYNTFRNTLVQRFDGFQPPTVRCRWLSTQLIIDGRTYTLDDWLRDLYIVVEDFDRFTISILIDAWSVQHKIWPPDDAELHIVDNDGESHVFPVTAPMNDEWSALLPRPEEPEELYVESEEEEEEELLNSTVTSDEDVTTDASVAPVETPVAEVVAPVETPVAEVVASIETPVAEVVEAPVAEVVAPVEAPVEPTPLPPSPAPEEPDQNED